MGLGIRDACSIGLYLILWCSVGILPMGMARVASLYIRANLQMRTSSRNTINPMCYQWPTQAPTQTNPNSSLPQQSHHGWTADTLYSDRQSRENKQWTQFQNKEVNMANLRKRSGLETVEYVDLLFYGIMALWDDLFLILAKCGNLLYNFRMFSTSWIRFLLAILVAIGCARAFVIGDDQTVIVLQAGGNYSRNMTDAELKYVVNSISSAERQYNQTQLAAMAQAMSKNLETVFGQPWSVLVLNKGVRQIGSSVYAYRNKTAVFVKTGSYQLSYVVIQQNYCFHRKSYFNITQTKPIQIFGSSIDKKTELRNIVYSASTFAGSDIVLNSDYIRNQTVKLYVQGWCAIVVDPAVTSGSYLCNNSDYWALFMNNADFGWSYYLTRNY